MKLTYKNNKTSGECRLIFDERGFDRQFYGRDRNDKLLTIAWNKGVFRKVNIDGIEYDFAPDTIVCLLVNRTYNFADATDIVAWQFNRAFYCIVDHDKEVSCVGFLFYGSQQLMFTGLDKEDSHKVELLLQVWSAAALVRSMPNTMPWPHHQGPG